MIFGASMRILTTAFLVSTAAVTGARTSSLNDINGKDAARMLQEDSMDSSETAKLFESTGSTKSVEYSKSAEFSEMLESTKPTEITELSELREACELAEADKAPENASTESNNSMVPDASGAGQEIKMVGQSLGIAVHDATKWLKKAFGVTMHDAKKLLRKTYDALLDADEKLQAADEERNTSEAKQHIDVAWLSLIKAMQRVGELGKPTNAIMDFIDKIVQKIDELTEQMAAMAIKKANGALNDAEAEFPGIAKRLQSAIETLENADVAANAEICGVPEKYMREVFGVMRRSVKIVVELVLEDTKNRGDDDAKGFTEAMKAFGEALESFNSNPPDRRLVVEAAMMLKQSADKVHQEAGMMGPAAIIMTVKLSRIVGGIQKAVYAIMRNTITDVLLFDEKTMEQVNCFDGAARAVKLEFHDFVAKEYEFAEATKSLCSLDAAARESKTTDMDQMVDQIRASVGKIKERCKAVSREFKKMMEIIKMEERAKRKYGGNKSPGKGTAGDLGQEICSGAYLLEKVAVVRRRILLWILERAYGHEQRLANLEQKFAKVKRKFNRDRHDDNYGAAVWNFL